MIDRTLYWIRCSILSQWRDLRRGVMWHDLGDLDTARAEELRMSWRRLSWDWGRCNQCNQCNQRCSVTQWTSQGKQPLMWYQQYLKYETNLHKTCNTVKLQISRFRYNQVLFLAGNSRKWRYGVFSARGNAGDLFLRILKGRHLVSSCTV